MAETCWLSLYPHLCPLAARLWAVSMCHFTVIILSLTQSDRAASTPAFSFFSAVCRRRAPIRGTFQTPFVFPHSVLPSHLETRVLLPLLFSLSLHGGLQHWHGPCSKPPKVFTAELNIRLAVNQCLCDLWPHRFTDLLLFTVSGSAGVKVHLPLPSHMG